MTITEFLTARLDEESRFWANPSAMRFGGVGLSELILRMRADIEAKRRIMALTAFSDDPTRSAVDFWMGLEREDLTPPPVIAVLIDVMCHMASLYESHKDYDPAWRVG